MKSTLCNSHGLTNASVSLSFAFNSNIWDQEHSRMWSVVLIVMGVEVIEQVVGNDLEPPQLLQANRLEYIITIKC